MNSPIDAVAGGSEIPLGTIVSLVRIAANNPHCEFLRLALPSEYREYLGCLKPKNETAFDYTGTRNISLNELCKEVLPYITEIYTLQERALAEKTRADTAEHIAERLRDENEKLKYRLNVFYQFEEQN